MNLLVPLMVLLSGGTYQEAIITSATECPTFPEFEIPDALEEVCGPLAFWSEKDKEYFRDYRVKSDTKQFTLNCTSNYPVQIRVTLTKPYTNATFALHSNPTEFKLSNGTITKGDCFKASITFLEVNENLSGLYACESFLTYNGNVAKYRPLGIFIYAHDTNDGTMLNREQYFTVQPEEDKSGESDKFSLYLPCTFNAPSLLKTEISYISEGQQISIDAPTKLCKDNRTLCMDFNSLPSEHSAAVIFQNGAQLSCSTNNSVNELDAAHLNILPLSDFKYTPTESEMVLEVKEGEVYKFFCQSSKPVSLTANYQHGYQMSVNTLAFFQDPYYQANLEILIPDGEAVSYLEWEFHYDYDSRDSRDRKVVALNVSCVEEDSNSSESLLRHEWTYNLIFTNRMDEDSDDLNPYFLDYEIERQFRSPYFLMCRSASPKTMHVYFVPCSTITECQMKAALLSDSDYLYDDWVTYFYHSVRFQLEPGISGMVRCVGFQKDIMSYFYVGFDEYDLHSRLSSVSNPDDDYVINPVVVLSETEVFVGEAVEVNCTSPLMLMMSASIFEFRFRNSTPSQLIHEEYILEQKSINENEQNIVFARILIPTFEVIGIACTNLQFMSVSPLVWKNGILQENADNYTLRMRQQTAFLNATIRLDPIETLPAAADTKGLYVGIAFAVLFLVGVVTTVHFFLRFRAQKKLTNKLTAEEIESFRNGRPELISENENANSNAQYYPFLPKYEIELTSLEINFKEKLGAGEFGIVYKGYLKLNEVVPVAVKTLKPGASGAHLRSAMAELKVMIFIGQHENIVKIIGACTNDLENEQLHVVMEFCENQSLLEHLRNNSQFFFDQVQKGVYYPDLLDDGSYACFVKTSDLIRWSFEIANGMQYISSLKVIHGDLAARNVLLDKQFTAKISDFGLSRKLYELPAYIRKKTVPLPWRWCALESLVQQQFSLASDVWSFGVTLWEIFSLGECPYPGLEYGNQFITMLTNNFRMAMPPYSSCETYNIMMECWNKEPTKRPTFSELRERLQVMNSLAHSTVKSFAETRNEDITKKSLRDQTALPDCKELKMQVGIELNCTGNSSPQSQFQYSRLVNPKVLFNDSHL